MKKIFKILTATVAAACVCGIAGCSSAASSLSLDSYWTADGYPRIQNSVIGTEEKLVYDVSIKSNSQGNKTYYISVDENETHTYTTWLGVGVYDWDSLTLEKVTESNKSNYKNSEGYYEAGENKEFVYYYETSLEFSGKYVYGSLSSTVADESNSVAFEDKITTVTYFRAAQYTLTPIYSYTYAKSTVPNVYQATSASVMCREVEYTYETQYNSECTNATYTYTDLTDEDSTPATSSLSFSGNVFDNNQLYMVIRGMNLSSSTSESLSLLIPADGGIGGVSISGSSTSELDTADETQKTIVDALVTEYGEPATDDSSEADSSTEDSTEESPGSGINYNVLNIANSSGKGQSQTAWYAAVEDDKNNQYRATLLYLAIPMSYDLGTLEYVLTDVVTTFG